MYKHSGMAGACPTGFTDHHLSGEAGNVDAKNSLGDRLASASQLLAERHGPGDNYPPENPRVIPALIRRFHEAKVNHALSVAIWGSGTPKREFVYVDDMAAASVHVMNLDKLICDQHVLAMLNHINVGCGQDIAIRELARVIGKVIGKVIGYAGVISCDPSKPDGTPRKLMDSTRLNSLGWNARIGLEEGLRPAYDDFLLLGPCYDPAVMIPFPADDYDSPWKDVLEHAFPEFMALLLPPRPRADRLGPGA
jgi:hypothetical protein